MNDTELDEYGTEFPHAIGRVAKRELAQAGLTRWQHLTQVAADELLAIHGVGPKAVRILRDELAARGLAFRERRGPGGGPQPGA